MASDEQIERVKMLARSGMFHGDYREALAAVLEDHAKLPALNRLADAVRAYVSDSNIVDLSDVDAALSALDKP